MLVVGIVKSLLAGACAAAPAGPVAVMVAQRTLSGGRRCGVACGIGSMVADTLYAALGLLTLGYVRKFVEGHEGWICLVGGVLLIAIGTVMAAGRNKVVTDRAMNFKVGKRTLAGYAIQTSVTALANPGALAAMMILLAFFRLDSTTIPVWVALPCIAAGELLWWTMVTCLVEKARVALSEATLSRALKALGVAVIVFGVVLAVRGLIKLL